MLASLGFRAYLHFFNTYTVTYGSLGAVIILLMWFYITGLMLLLGAEINCQIEAAAAAMMLTEGAGESTETPAVPIMQPASASRLPIAQAGQASSPGRGPEL
jgi:membrane protein